MEPRLTFPAGLRRDNAAPADLTAGKKTVKAGGSLALRLAPGGGGAAVRLAPVR